MLEQELVACHDCDLLQRLPILHTGEIANCSRCNATLYCRKKNPLNRSLALALTALILFIAANLFPFLSLSAKGQIVDSTLISGAIALFAGGNPFLSSLVLLTVFIFPLINIVGLLYILIRMKLSPKTNEIRPIYRMLKHAQPWGMLEVLLLAVLVAGVKLTDLATVIPGIALYSFVGLTFILAALDSTIDPHMIWRIEKEKQ